MISCIRQASFYERASNSQNRLNQPDDPAFELQRRIGDGEANTILPLAGYRLVGEVFVRLFEIAAMENVVAIAKASGENHRQLAPAMGVLGNRLSSRDPQQADLGFTITRGNGEMIGTGAKRLPLQPVDISAGIGAQRFRQDRRLGRG